MDNNLTTLHIDRYGDDVTFCIKGCNDVDMHSVVLSFQQAKHLLEELQNVISDIAYH